MIPGEIFTGFAEFQGIVSVNDFWFPLGFQELLQAPLCFLKFLFCTDMIGSIGWVSLAPRLQSMIVSRLTTFTENFVIGCNQITQIFGTKYDSANASSVRGNCDFGPLADLAISVFGK